MDSGPQHRKTAETGGTADSAEPVSGGDPISSSGLPQLIHVGSWAAGGMRRKSSKKKEVELRIVTEILFIFQNNYTIMEEKKVILEESRG